MNNMISLTESSTPRTTWINPDLNICIVKEDSEGNKSWLYAKNIVTNDGDLYYAQKSAGESATSDFGGSNGRMELRTGTATPAKGDTYNSVTTPVTASRKALDSNYPKTNDGDSDNTGAGVDIVTYKFSWTTSQIDTSSGNAITGGCIVDKAATLGGSVKILTHWNFSSPASFHKTSTDTLTLYVNHTMNGV